LVVKEILPEAAGRLHAELREAGGDGGELHGRWPGKPGAKIKHGRGAMRGWFERDKYLLRHTARSV
jgi:hypothetical protein